jgi:hypothetical protein
MIKPHKTHIMVHCLATRKAWGEGKTAKEIMKEVTHWHVVDNGWRGVAYAAIIGPDGDWAKGRDLDADGDVWEETGAGAKGWNKNVIHLALAGGHGSHEDDQFSDHFTVAQDTTLRKLIKSIRSKAKHELKLIGHNQVAAKACPGFNVVKWYNSEPLAAPATPSTQWVNPAEELVDKIRQLIAEHDARENKKR